MRKNIDMVNGPLFSSILRYSVPIMLTSVLQLLFNAADLVVVGRYCGSIYMAAVSATSSIINLIINLFIGLSVGAGVAVAHGLGGQKDDEVHRTVHTTIPTALAAGIVLTITGITFAEDFLTMMSTPASVLPHSATYMRIYFGGMVFSMLYNFSASILRAAGDTKSPLIFLSISGVVNVVLNFIFVTVFHMNVDGVALATIISQALSAVLVTITLMRRTDACKLSLLKIRFYKSQLLKIIRIGLPAGIQGCLFSISNVVIQSSINSFNSDAIMSGNGAALNIEGFIYVIQNSFHQAAVNFVGQNVGAHRFDRVKKVLFSCMGFVTVFSLIVGGAVWIFGEPLLSIYITDSPEAIAEGMVRLTYLAVPYFMCGLMDVAVGAIRGLGASVVPMLISILGVCGIRILWVYTIFQIPQYHTMPCLLSSYTISWTITFLCQSVAFFLVYKKKTRSLSAYTH